MKKILSIIITGILISSVFVGCGNEKPQKVDAQKQEQKQENKTETFKIGDTVKTKNFNITVNKVDTSNGGDFIKPKDGKEFLKVDITVENISDQSQSVSSVMMFKVVDKDGRSYDQAFTENQNGQLDGEVGAGRKMTGEYIVEMPKGATGLQLEFDSSLLTGGQVIVDLN